MNAIALEPCGKTVDLTDYHLAPIAPKESRLAIEQSRGPARDEDPRKRQRDASLVMAERRLNAWAAWAKEHRIVIGYPTISSLFRVMMDSKRRLLDDMVELHITAQGKQTQSFREVDTFVPEPIAEVDAAVARLPRPLERVITANYFTYGPIEVRAKAAGLKRARFFQLLESAKYAIWVSLNHVSGDDK